MEALCEGGAGPSYPEVFTSLEWEAFLALKLARGKDQAKDFQTKPKPPQRDHQAELNKRMGIT